MNMLIHLFVLLIATSIYAQKALPLTTEHYLIDPDTEEWYLYKRASHAYDLSGNLILSEGIYSNPLREENPFKKEHGYNKDNLLIMSKTWSTNPNTGVLYQSSLQENTYAENGNMSLITIENWDIHPYTREVYRSRFQKETYTDNGKILSTYKWNNYPQAILFGREDPTIYENTYLYDDNNCLIKEIGTRLDYDEALDSIVVIKVDTRANYKVTADCKILMEEIPFARKDEFIYNEKSLVEVEKNYQWIPFQNYWMPSEKKVFSYNEKNLPELVYKTRYGGDRVRLDSFTTRATYYYDGQNNEAKLYLEERQNISTQTWCELDRYEYFFDPRGIRRLEYLIDRSSQCGNYDSFLWETENSYEFYENGFLKEAFTHSRKYNKVDLTRNSEERTTYIRRCDGTILEEKVTVENRLPYWYGSNTYHLKYTYTLPADCEVKTDTVPQMNLFPNPTNHDITIKSDLLFHPNIQIYIYNMDGKLISTLSSKFIAPQQDFDVSFLAAGIYILELLQGEQLIRTRLVITD